MTEQQRTDVHENQDVINPEHPEAVADLIRASFPKFNISSIEYRDEAGTANFVFRVNNEWIFRFAKNQRASRRGEMEIHTLPTLRKSITLPIPEIEYAGVQPNGFMFIGYREIEGTSLTKDTLQALPPAEKDAVYDSLATFFREVHSFDLNSLNVRKVQEMPFKDEFQRALREDIPVIEPHFSTDDIAKIKSLITTYLDDENSLSFRPNLLHGDLNAENILFDQQKKQVTGVIDFGDMFIGDPLYDYAQLYFSYGEEIAREVLKREGFARESDFQKVKFFHLTRQIRILASRIKQSSTEDQSRRIGVIKSALTLST